MPRRAFSFVLNIIIATATSATNYYVSPIGNNANSGLDPAAAWAAVEHGDTLGVINPGDTVFILPGTYAPSATITLTQSGTPVSPIVYLRKGVAPAIITMGNSSKVGIAVKGSYTVLDGVTVMDANEDAVKIEGFGCTVRNGHFHDVAKMGVHVTGTNNLIQRNVICEVGGSGIKNENAGQNNLYYGNTVCGSSSHGIDLASGVNTARVFNNIVVNNDRGISGSSQNVCGFNNVWGNKGDGYGGGVADSAGGISVMPLFVDVASGRFDLKAGSSEIDAGLDLGYSFNGSAPEIGAKEKFNVYYVSWIGDDGNDGLSESMAWQHIDYGSEVLMPGDTLFVLPGTYPDSVVVAYGGILDEPVVYSCTGDSCWVEAMSSYSGVRLNASYVVWEGIGVSGAGNTNIEINGSRNVVDGVRLVGSGAYGIKVVMGVQNQISRCVLFDNDSTDICLLSDTTVVLNNSAYSRLVGVDAMVSNSHTLINNIFLGSPDAATGVKALSTSVLLDDIVFGFTQSVQGGIALGQGCLLVDPQLVNPDAGDLRLGSLSPAIDNGRNVDLPFEGSAPDMGAFETGYLAALVIVPDITQMSADSSYHFGVSALDSAGNPCSYGTLTWSHTFTSGAITDDGEFEPVLVDSGFIIVSSTVDGISDTSLFMTVSPGSLSKLSIEPDSDTVNADSTQQFTASGADSEENSVSDLGQLTWSVTNNLGSIDVSGLFDARRVGKGFVRVTSDLGVLAVSDTIVVTPGALAFIDVVPSQNSVAALQSYQYAAYGYDSDSNLIIDITNLASWSASGGSISGSGLYTAGLLPGTYQVSASYAGFSDNGSVQVGLLGGGLSYIRIEYENGAAVTDTTETADNDYFRVYARGYTAGDALIGDVAVTWSLTGADTIGALSTLSGPSTVLELRQAGTGNLRAQHASGNNHVSGLITCIAGAPVELLILPDSASITADSSLQFVLTALDNDGNSAVLPSIVNWTLLSDIGAISSTGLFIPVAAGSGMIIAAGDGLADTAAPVVVTAGALVDIEVVPDSIIISADSAIQFAAIGLDSKGNSQDAGNIQWELIGTVGSIDATGFFDALAAGTARVAAVSDLGPIDTSAYLEVVPGELATLTIVPDSAVLTADETQVFTAEGRDADDNTTPTGSLTWGVLGGIGVINSLGEFAPTRIGDGQITVSSRNGVVDTNSLVSVTAGSLSYINVSPNMATVKINDSVQFIVMGYDAAFNPAAIGALTWGVEGGIGAIDSSGLFRATDMGYGAVTALSSFNNVSDTSGTITVEALRISAIALGNQTAHPTDSAVPLLTTRLFNDFSTDKLINRLTVQNRFSGAGTSSQVRTNVDSLYVYIDVDSNLMVSAVDSLVAQQILVEDTTTFLFSFLRVDANSTVDLLIAGSISSQSRDGDTLDLSLEPATGISTTDGTTVEGTAEINSAGVVVIDGLVAEQVQLLFSGRTEISPADSVQLVMTVDIPRNGYSQDSLRTLHIFNAGTSSESDFDSLVLFLDNGDGSWGGYAEEVRLGKLVYTGESWIRGGLTVPLSNPLTRFYLGAKIAAYPVEGATIALGFPLGGLEMRSANDGPIDSPVEPKDTIVIRTNERVSVSLLPISARSCAPGSLTGPIQGFSLTNSYSQSVIIDTVRVQMAAFDPDGATASQLAGQIDSVYLYLDRDGNIGLQSPLDTLIAQTTLADSIAEFNGLNLSISASGGSARLFVNSKLNLLRTKNSNDVGFELSDSSFIQGSQVLVIDGNFPVSNAEAFTVDAFPSAAINTERTQGVNLFAGQTDQLVLDFDLPRNGYASDRLLQLDIVNAGTLENSDILEVIKLWKDATGNGFSADDIMLGNFQKVGDLWRITNLNTLLAQEQNRFFITVSIRNAQFEGGTLELGIPVTGVDYASGLVGPDDRDVSSNAAHLIFPSNRVTAISIPIASTVVLPGSSSQLMAFALYNGYVGQTKQLNQVVLTNNSRSRGGLAFADYELGQVALYHDVNRNRIFDSDSLVATGYFSNGELTLKGLSVPIAAESLAYFFVTCDLPQDITDSDSLAVAIMQTSAIGFAENVNLNGDLPLSSGGYLVVNGSIVGQYAAVNTPGRSLAPGENQVTLFAFRPADNGYPIDTLEALALVNQGNADTASISLLELWQDIDGDNSWSAPDVLLGVFNYINGLWVISNLEIEIGSIPPVLLVVGQTSLNAAPNATIRLELPVLGCQYVSGNDGPIDGSLIAPGDFIISSSGLRVALGSLKGTYSIGQVIDVSIGVTNILSTDIGAVTAELIAVSDSALVNLDSIQSGPSAILSGEQQTFHFYFTSVSEGNVDFQLRATAPEIPDSSAVVQSTSVTIQRTISQAAVNLINSTPTAVTKGQINVFPLTLTCKHPDSGQFVASMELDNLTLHVTDAAGQDIEASSAFSRIVLSSGYQNLSIFDTVPSLSTLNLPFNSSVVIAPQQTAAFSLLIDVDSSATAGSFQLQIDDASFIPLSDMNTGSPTPVNPAAPFPLKTASCRIDSPSQSVAISGESQIGTTVNLGQEDVSVLLLQLRHSGSLGSSPVQVTQLSVAVRDSIGEGLAVDEVFERLTIVRQGNIIGQTIITPVESSLVAVTLSAPINLNPGEIDSIYVKADLKFASGQNGFYLEIKDSSAFVVRDLNTGSALAAVADTSGLAAANTFPIISSWALLKQSSAPLNICLSSTAPAAVVGGADSVSMIRIDASYLAGPSYSAVNLRSIRIIALDSLDKALDPDLLFDRIGYRMNAGPIIYRSGLLIQAGSVIFSFDSSSITLQPQEAVSLELFADVEADAPYSHFRLLVVNTGDVAIDDVSDTSHHPGFITGSGCAQTIPFATSMTRIYMPAGRPALILSKPPVQLVSVGSSNVSLFNGILSYPPSSLQGELETRAVRARVVKRTGSGTEAASLSALFQAVHLLVEGVEVATDSVFSGDSLYLAPAAPIIVASGEQIEVRIAADLAVSAPLGNYVTLIDDSTYFEIIDKNLLITQYAYLIENTFPLETGEISVVAAGLRESFTNYPNPFIPSKNEATTIAFVLSEEAYVDIEIFSITGESVLLLTGRSLRLAGSHQSDQWSGDNGKGLAVVPGTYFCRITAKYLSGREESFRRKIAVVR